MGPTDPNEQYFFRGLWGWVTDQWKKLVADDSGHLQVDVVTSGLPTGAATSANQTTMITALQLIDDLRAALNSVATDELDVVIDGQSADVEVKQTTPADLTPGIEGWDGSAWRKLPMLWGYSDRWYESVTHTKSGAGDYSLSTAVVPSGYVYVVDFITTVNSGTVCTHYHELYAVGAGIVLQAYTSVGANVWTPTFPVGVALKADDRVGASFVTCADGNVLYLKVWGYKMKVAE